MKKASKIYSGLFVRMGAYGALFFLYLPLLLIVFYSFNEESVNAFPIKHFSLKWYSKLFENKQILKSLYNSLLIAVLSTLLSLCIGVPAAYGMNKYDFFGKRFLERIILLPITLPGIVTGVAMLSFFPKIGISLSLLAVFIGHTTFLCDIVITQILARLKRLDPLYEQAAYDLGANQWRCFFQVILPNIKTSIIGATLLCLVLSFDEIPVTFFLIAGENTLPIEIYSVMRRGVTPEINAISTLIFLASIIALIFSIRLSEKKI